MHKILVLSHSADFDGLCSGAIARKALGDTALHLGFDYGQDVPDLTPYDTVYLIDVSLPIDAMIQYAAKIRLIDHHVSLLRELDERKVVLQDRYTIVGVAACRLAYQYFFGDRAHTLDDYVNRRVQEPYAVQLLGEYDIWNHSDQNTVPFQYGINSLKTVEWNRLFCADRVTESANGNGAMGGSADAFYVHSIIDKGRAIETYVTQTNAEISTKRGFDVQFEGLLFRALNTARASGLSFLGSLRLEHDGCLAYHWDGTKWRFSMYSVPGKTYDFSAIAKRYGGGGHAGASAFTINDLPNKFGGASQ